MRDVCGTLSNVCFKWPNLNALVSAQREELHTLFPADTLFDEAKVEPLLRSAREDNSI